MTTAPKSPCQIQVRSHSKARYRDQEQHEEAHRLGVRIIEQTDPDYPEPLRELPDAPARLYVKGVLPSDLRAVACVGSREPTRWGAVAAQRISQQLASEGYSIISGLARGVDQLAHAAALAAGGQTIAVLPCGLDSIYPHRHADLAARILDAGGALLSELPFGATMHPRHFVRRNRIISGLSLATVIIQAAARGGTMHTARFCQKQGRLLCVTAPQGRYVEGPETQGNLQLLQQPGSFALRSRADYPALLQRLQQL